MCELLSSRNFQKKIEEATNSVMFKIKVELENKNNLYNRERGFLIGWGHPIRSLVW